MYYILWWDIAKCSTFNMIFVDFLLSLLSPPKINNSQIQLLKTSKQLNSLCSSEFRMNGQLQVYASVTVLPLTVGCWLLVVVMVFEIFVRNSESEFWIGILNRNSESEFSWKMARNNRKVWSRICQFYEACFLLGNRKDEIMEKSNIRYLRAFKSW